VTQPSRSAVEPSFRELLGGRAGVVDGSLPVAGFVLGWAVAEGLAAPNAVVWGVGVAVAAALAVAVFRIRRGRRPVAAMFGLLGVVVAGLVAVVTGRAADFFALQLLSNAASVLVWTVSIAIRWPLLGVVVGFLLGQATRWRRDPDLVRAYSRASWVWVAQYLVRLAVFLPLYLAGAVIPLGIARVALTWPLVAVCVLVSGWVLVGSLPDGHPGIRRPRSAV
jgi:hypothetical protein